MDYSDNASLVPSTSEHNYEAEREMLWQLIYGLRNEISELNRKVDSLQSDKSPIIKPEPVQSLIKYEPPKDSSSEITVSPLEQADKETIIAALKKNNGNKKITAEELNISQRTLYRKIHELGIE